MAKQQTEETTLENYAFDDGDAVFSNWASNLDAPPMATPQTKSKNGSPLPDFEDDDGSGPVNIDKVKVDKTPEPIKTDNTSSESKKKVARPSAPKEEDDDEEVPDAFFKFGEEAEAAMEAPKPKPKPKQEPKKPAKKEEEDEDELPHPGKKALEEETEDNEGEDEEDSVVDKDSKYFTNLALDLRDRGTFREVQIDENAELTEDEFFELQEKEYEVRLDEAFEQFADEMDADGKDFIKAKRKGMPTRDFITRYLAPTFDLPDFDASNKTHVSKTINHYLTTIEGLEGEELEDRKEWLKNSGKEAVHAQKYFDKIQRLDAARKQQIMASLEQRVKDQQDAVDQFNADLAEVLNKTEQVGVFTINKNSRKEIYEAITKPTIKAKKGSYIPKLVARISKILSGQTEKDLKDLIALTMIVESDFNLPSLKEDVETQVTKTAKARISKKQPVASSGPKRRELADFF